ncbi:MAG: rhomboid family intramembrane serine protease [Flavobacteriaceae bacterium]|nr:rhomboid family intramembrane serine protease [Flavobacteriaceae bacterium]|tara:strand:+ start:10948 stop:11685 length:738 start_codon:yes stop_codon:yes gene_type:complete
MRSVSETVKHLLIINGIFFFATLVLGEQLYDFFALHYPESPKFKYWQILTHMFMHGDFTHILFNMFGLWMFGTPIEQMWGKNKFIFFYLSAGLGAAILQLTLYFFQIYQVNELFSNMSIDSSIVSEFYSSSRLPSQLINQLDVSLLQGAFSAYNSVLVGASGALYGVLVAFAMLFPNTQLMLLFPPIPVRAKYLVPFLIAADVFFGFTSYSIGPIAHFAHVGGALTGFIIMRYWKRNQFNNNRWN